MSHLNYLNNTPILPKTPQNRRDGIWEGGWAKEEWFRRLFHPWHRRHRHKPPPPLSYYPNRVFIHPLAANGLLESISTPKSKPTIARALSLSFSKITRKLHLPLTRRIDLQRAPPPHQNTISILGHNLPNREERGKKGLYGAGFAG